MPRAASGSEARAHLLATFAVPEAGSRGVGVVAAKHGDRREGSLEVRWATLAESTVVFGYAGPVRAIDASMLGDSLYVALRTSDLGFAGPVREREGLGPAGLRFLARPWDLSAAWVKDAIEHAAVEARDKGWRLRGTFASGGSAHPFTLDLDGRGDPARLAVARPGGRGERIVVRYGPTKSFRGGTMPRWIEWTQGSAVIRLSIDEYARGEPARFRHAPAADPEWTLMTLDDPRSRDLLRRYLGIGERGEDP